MPGQPEASVVISAYSGPAVTRRCLESIASALGPELGRRFELVLVDNGSVDDTGVLLDAWSDRARIVRLPENRNFAGGMNAGVHAAAGDVVVLLNTDMVVPAGTLERLVVAARDPAVAIAGARLLYPDGFHQHGGVIFRPIAGGLTGLSHLFQFEPGEIPAGRACYDVEALTGACMAVRRELFLEVGGFDEEYVNDLDDIDLSLRLRTRGLRLRYLGDVTIEHRESVTRTTYDQASHDRFHARWADGAPAGRRAPGPHLRGPARPAGERGAPVPAGERRPAQRGGLGGRPVAGGRRSPCPAGRVRAGGPRGGRLRARDAACAAVAAPRDRRRARARPGACEAARSDARARRARRRPPAHRRGHGAAPARRAPARPAGRSGGGVGAGPGRRRTGWWRLA